MKTAKSFAFAAILIASSVLTSCTKENSVEPSTTKITNTQPQHDAGTPIVPVIVKPEIEK